jgi:hypothetical protein
MKIQFNQNYDSPTYAYKKGDVIDSTERPDDQVTRWLNRAVVKPVEEKPIKKAVAKNSEIKTADIK